MSTMGHDADDDQRWAALVARDPGADGRFWYGVRTTGVFCRPTCASRRPNRANVEFFATADAALRRGFRACRRCRPDRPPAADPIVVAACRLIEAAPDPARWTLDGLAARSGLSRRQFHHRFRAATGVTPRAFALALAAQPGDRTMTATATRRPATSQATVRVAAAPCRLGWVLVAANDRGICAIDLGADRAELLDRLAARFPRVDRDAPDDPDLLGRVAAVVGHLELPARGLDLPLDIQGTAFQRLVWDALRAIPAGQTASYAEVAQRIGQPSAARAVARACASNTLALAIPCHRVVRGDGSMGGFRWGVERKRALLDREAASAEDPNPAPGGGPVD